MPLFDATACAHKELPADVARQMRRRGGLLGQLMIRGQLLHHQLEYLKSYRVRVCETSGGQLWDVVLDAVTLECGLLEDCPELSPCEGVAFAGAPGYCTENEARSAAERFVRRLTARLFLRMGQVRATDSTAFYRPHWVAYYGKSPELPTHFLHFPADACSFHR